MSLSQSIFAGNISKLISFINLSGYTCTGGEWWRTPEMAEIYAKRGIGIKRSRHCDRMAWDFNLFKDGVYLTDTESYRFAGEYWCSLDPRNRWGGDWDGDGIPDPGENDGNHVEMREAL